MPRRCKQRRICALPAWGQFGPLGGSASSGVTVTMALEEFECIRLMDLEGQTQEACAAQMGVARTTVQSIYAQARMKLAQCLVQGAQLRIEGGDYVLCDGGTERCPRSAVCQKKTQEQGTERKLPMKIAVTYENGKIFQHFGHTEYMKLYDVENHQVVSSQVVSTNGHGHGALAGFLLEQGVDVLICGGIGGGAQQALRRVGIQLYGGVSGEADRAVEAFLTSQLQYNPNVQCSHHGEGHHHHGGDCGSHSCGSHTCGH